ncbi:MAG: Dabb family protein [Chthoniobacterales bacterium]
MVHHLVLFKLKPKTTDETVENMMRETRMQLLKIPEVLNIKCGKRVDPENKWQFFLAVDFESMDRLAVYAKDPIHVKFVEEVIKPNVSDRLALDYEMEPGKDVTYS